MHILRPKADQLDQQHLVKLKMYVSNKVQIEYPQTHIISDTDSTPVWKHRQGADAAVYNELSVIKQNKRKYC